jgi:hypothetical protein
MADRIIYHSVPCRVVDSSNLKYARDTQMIRITFIKDTR